MFEFRSEAVIALGGNMPSPAGPPARTLGRAVAEMARAGMAIRAVSRFFATPCFPAGAGPGYVNAAVRIRTALDPEALLAALHQIEAGFGRQRTRRWGGRTLDLDLICVGDTVLPDPETQHAWRMLPPDRQALAAPDRLILPHPRLQDRAFVLVPMADIAPDWRHPLLSQTVREMLAALGPGQVASVRPL